ncbi:MAG: leucyl/phenylalanyl-tRNA--protein transferase [Mariprofundaceae bacterium]
MVEFPEPELADAQGLVAAGGDLKLETLLAAYAKGIFPWFSRGQPILWWSPDPRMVLFADEFYCSSRLARRLKQPKYRFSWDEAFSDVIHACAAPRAEDEGTWILPEMIAAYENMHALGHAHSVEVWVGERLIGGLYGVLLNDVFFAESMFSRQTDASKMALAKLVGRARSGKWKLIDCQFYTAHLASLGAKEIPRSEFLATVRSENISR